MKTRMWTNVPKARQCVRLKDFATFAKRTHASKRFINTYNTWMPTSSFKKIAQMLAAVFIHLQRFANVQNGNVEICRVNFHLDAGATLPKDILLHAKRPSRGLTASSEAGRNASDTTLAVALRAGSISHQNPFERLLNRQTPSDPRRYNRGGQGVLHGAGVQDAHDVAGEWRRKRGEERPVQPVLTVQLDDLLVGVRALEDLNAGIHRHATSREENLDSVDCRVKRVRFQRPALDVLGRVLVLTRRPRRELFRHQRGHREFHLANVADGDRARAARDLQHGADGPNLTVLRVHAGLERGVPSCIPDLDGRFERAALRTEFDLHLLHSGALERPRPQRLALDLDRGLGTTRHGGHLHHRRRRPRKPAEDVSTKETRRVQLDQEPRAEQQAPRHEKLLRTANAMSRRSRDHRSLHRESLRDRGTVS